MTYLMALASGCLMGLMLVASILVLMTLTTVLFKGRELGLRTAVSGLIFGVGIPAALVCLCGAGLQRTLEFPLDWLHGLSLMLGFIIGLVIATNVLQLLGINLPIPEGEAP